jgi:hypothetical protein
MHDETIRVCEDGRNQEVEQRWKPGHPEEMLTFMRHMALL